MPWGRSFLFPDRKPEGPPEDVILVHGIWMNSLELLPFGLRLKGHGFRVSYFNYHSILGTPAQAAERLHGRVRSLKVERLHYVAHSLGGLVLMHLFEQFGGLPPGRIVMLGSPVGGSRLARRIAASAMGRPLIGKSLERGLSGEDLPVWRGEREWAMFTGDRPFGVATLLGGLGEANDGAVTIEETRHPAQKVHLTLPLNHLGLLYSSITPALTAEFLRSGTLRG